MATSKRRVPWCSLNEWKSVKKMIVSSKKDDWTRAYETMLVWKARSLKLPINVENTFGILQVLIMEEPTFSKIPEEPLLSAESNLQLSYSTALVRFVNNLTASTTKHRDSLYLTAHKQNIPDWVVNLRHDVAHSAFLPPLPLLHQSIQLARLWLIENYWDPEEDEMIDTQHDVDVLIHDAISGWHSCASNIRSNPTLVDNRELIRTKAKSLCKQLPGLKFSKLETWLEDWITNQRLICKKFLNASKKICEKDTKASGAIPDCIFSLGFLKSGGEDFDFWWPIIDLQHRQDSLETLLRYLFERLGSSNDDEVRQAANWLRALYIPILENAQRWKLGEEDDTLAQYSFSCRPPPCVHLGYLQNCLLNPNSISIEVVRDYFRFVTPTIPSATKKLIKKLTETYLGGEMSLDQKEEIVCNGIISDESDEIHGLEHLVPETNLKPTKTWRKINVPSGAVGREWRRCPLGILPHQKSHGFDLDLTIRNYVFKWAKPRDKQQQLN